MYKEKTNERGTIGREDVRHRADFDHCDRRVHHALGRLAAFGVLVATRILMVLGRPGSITSRSVYLQSTRHNGDCLY